MSSETRSDAPPVVGYRRDNAEVDPPYLYPELPVARDARARRGRSVLLPHTLSEVTGPVFGHDRVGELRPRPHAPARGRAARRADHRDRARARRRRPAGAATRWSRSGRPTPPGATRHDGDQHPAPLDPNFTGAGRCLTDDDGPLPLRHRSSPAPTRGGTTTTPGGPRTSTSRCSGRRSPRGWSRRCTSPATRSSSRTRSSTRCRDPRDRERLISRFDLDSTVPEWALGYQLGHRAARPRGDARWRTT